MEKLMQVSHLKKYFPLQSQTVLKAVDDVTLDIYKGEVLSLVGESGSGKTTFGRTICKLYEKTFGDIQFEGKDIDKISKKDLTKDIQMIFQDPQASLNPRMTVGDIIAEGMDIHKTYENRKQRQEKIYELLEIVGLNREHANRFPHEFSGGQRQRIGVARSVATKPKLIIADEPVSALDLSVQAQVLNYMKDIQKQFGLSYIFISHDLGVVKHMCDEIYIMYKGRFVEKGLKNDIYQDARHIYTKRLIAAIPDVDPSVREQNMINRINVEKEYLEKESKYYDKNGKVFDLKPLSFNSTHYVALKDEVE